jgi:hypothetical protein
MTTDRTVSLREALPLLAKSKRVKDRLREVFDRAGQRALLRKMRERDTADEAGAEAHDFLLDEIGNHYDVVWNGVIPTEDDEYPVQIKRYEGVYLVWAMEYDDEGYFLCYADAKDYVDSNWPEAIEVSDDSPSPRKRGIEQERANAYLQQLADEKVNRIRWVAPPQPEAFVWWIERIQQPLPEDIDSRITLIEGWLAEPEKPRWRSHGYMATSEMPILIRLLGDQAATENLLQGLKEQRPELAVKLVTCVLRIGKEAARYFQRPWSTYGYGSIASIGFHPLFRIRVTIGLRVQAIAERLQIRIPRGCLIGPVPFHNPDSPINGGYDILETAVPRSRNQGGQSHEKTGGPS